MGIVVTRILSGRGTSAVDADRDIRARCGRVAIRELLLSMLFASSSTEEEDSWFVCICAIEREGDCVTEGTRSARGDVHSAFPVFGVQAMHSPRCDSVNTHCPSDVDDSQSQKTVIVRPFPQFPGHAHYLIGFVCFTGSESRWVRAACR